MAIQLSAYDIYHLISELQVLVGGKIEKVFQQEKPHQDFLFSIHVSGKAKQHLYISLPSIMCLSDFKPVFPSMPPSFCSSLRRKISNARITSITQHEFQRIIIIDLESKQGKSKLLVELFSQGNIILVNEEMNILAVLHRKVWNEDRKILHGQTYILPKQDLDLTSISQEEFSVRLANTDKDSLVTFLAIECGLGGTYAEHILKSSNLDKNVDPKSFKDADKLFNKVKELLNQKSFPILSKDKLYVLPIVEGQSFPSISQLISSVVLEQLEKREEVTQTKHQKESLSKYDKVMKSQEKQLTGLLKSSQENQGAGELIYNHYQELKDVLEILSSDRTQEDKTQALAKFLFIKKIDFKKRQLQVELE